MFNSSEISFEDVHKSCKKSTPKQITNYQMSLKLHKILNEQSFDCSLEYVRVIDQIVCPRRQILFRIFKTNNYRIGMNTTANKLFYLNDLITLDSISYGYVHFKKIMKVQFLKYGKTWCKLAKCAKSLTMAENVIGNLNVWRTIEIKA